MARIRRRALAALVLVVAAALAGAAAGTASASTVWLCRPGQAADPCTPNLSTTLVSPSGAVLGTTTPHRVRHPKIDCFYVYPTVSDEKTPEADLTIGPEERSIALYQAARYSQVCRVFAPMYRQITLAGLNAPSTVTPAMNARAYADVRDAWRTYLRRFNHGRGVVLIGHSQGSFVLRELVAKEIDRKPSVRRRLVSAILLGGNVVVRRGRSAGGDFRHVRACRSARQLHCVVAFSTFGDTPPADTKFGLPAPALGVGPTSVAGLEVLCTNPASLHGGAGVLDSILPTAPFAPGTVLGAVTPLIGFPTPTVGTTWIEARGTYTAHCIVSPNGAHVLLITPRDGAPVLHAIPDATWGLHLVDASIALGNLVDLVRTEAARFSRH